MFFGLLFEVGIFCLKWVGLGWVVGVTMLLLHMHKVFFETRVQLP